MLKIIFFSNLFTNLPTDETKVELIHSSINSIPLWIGIRIDIYELFIYMYNYKRITTKEMSGMKTIYPYFFVFVE